jgi:hypothetical protein
MPEVRLQFQDGVFDLRDGVTTLGRTSENDVSFPSDGNVSRFHAEIERRGEEYCLIDLNSSNGTTVNGEKVAGEIFLRAGDRIVLGGSSELVFGEAPVSDATDPAAEVTAAAEIPVMAAPPIPVSSPPLAEGGGSRTILFVAGGSVLVAVLVLAVAGAIYYGATAASCSATAKIVEPRIGETLSGPTEVEIEVEGGECVAEAVYTLDGDEFARSEVPFNLTLDPRDHSKYSDGSDHALAVTLLDADGKKIFSSPEIPVVINTRSLEKPRTDDRPPASDGNSAPPPGPNGKEMSLIDVSKMADRFAGQFTGGRRYNLNNPEFLREVRGRAAEYAVEGYYERAAAHRDDINLAFIGEANLDAPIGYVLAMSRSKFDPRKQGAGVGLWRMESEFAKAHGYDGPCGQQTIADPKQLCAARVAAKYTGLLLTSVFKGDVALAAAAFGKSTSDAANWNATLPAEKNDIWAIVRTPAERDQLVRFFAAGIVAENPGAFGLKRAMPLSTLYPQ